MCTSSRLLFLGDLSVPRLRLRSYDRGREVHHQARGRRRRTLHRHFTTAPLMTALPLPCTAPPLLTSARPLSTPATTLPTNAPPLPTAARISRPPCMCGAWTTVYEEELGRRGGSTEEYHGTKTTSARSSAFCATKAYISKNSHPNAYTTFTTAYTMPSTAYRTPTISYIPKVLFPRRTLENACTTVCLRLPKLVLCNS